MDPLMKYAFELEVQAEFHQTDAAGVVHFSYFFIWMEVAEHAFLRHAGITIIEKNTTHIIGWPKTKTACEFYKPAYLNDRIQICLTVTVLKNTYLSYQFYFFKKTAKDPTLLAKGTMQSCYAQIDKLQSIEKRSLSSAIIKRLSDADALFDS
jgi:acyl-CoA thioester hydrolase